MTTCAFCSDEYDPYYRQPCPECDKGCWKNRGPTDSEKIKTLELRVEQQDQLFQQILNRLVILEKLNKRIEALELHIKYAPNGEGYHLAQQSFTTLLKTTNSLNITE